MSLHTTSHLPILIFLTLALQVHSRVLSVEVLFTHQSQSISFASWLDIFTVCLAPLIAHVAAGNPTVTLIGSSPQGQKKCNPSWIARLPHFNPISITWRYFAIADRRARATCWDKR